MCRSRLSEICRSKLSRMCRSKLKKNTYLENFKSTQTNIEIPKKLFSKNQDVFQTRKISYPLGVRRESKTNNTPVDLFKCHPYKIFGLFSSDINCSLREYINQSSKMIYASTEMDKWFHNFFLILKTDVSDFGDYHKSDLNRISKMKNYHTYTDIFEQYKILRNWVINEHEYYINQRFNYEYQNTFRPNLTSVLSNYMMVFDELDQQCL